MTASMERLLSHAEAACSNADAAAAVWEDGVTIPRMLRLLRLPPVGRDSAERQRWLRAGWQQHLVAVAGQLLVYGEGRAEGAALLEALLELAEAAVAAAPPSWAVAVAAADALRAAEAGEGGNGCRQGLCRVTAPGAHIYRPSHSVPSETPLPLPYHAAGCDR
jgi:hypothetical protein